MNTTKLYIYKHLYLIVSIVFLIHSTALASNFTIKAPQKAQQGNAILVAAISKTPESNATFFWLKKKLTIPFKKSGSLWKAQTLLPVPLDAIGDKMLIVQTQKYSKQLKVSIDKVCWPVQNITMTKKKKKYIPQTSHSKNIEKRILEEQELITKKLSNISCIQYWDKHFIRPVPGIITSQFGGKRFFNGKQCSYHTGVDLRAAIGTPIKAAASGKVILSQDLYYAGKTIFIDHGQGIFTIYCHMSQRNAKVGDLITAGQKIGLSGSTGRSTGPHLHFGLKILGYYLDPMSLFPQ